MANAIGYDVSDYQSSIPANAQFVFVKASEGAHTEQTSYAAKRDAARSRSLVLGHYHFLHAENDIQGEVDHFCRVVGDVPTSELLVLDFEPYGQPVTDAQATAAKNAWLAAIRQRYPGHLVGTYTSVDWWHRTDDIAGDFLWVADYVQAGAPRIQAPWKFHQFTDTPLDTDMYNGTIADLRAWIGAATPDPAAAPPAAGPWPGLQLVTRAQWGARPWTEPNGSIPYAGPRLGVKIHYLGSPYTFGDHSSCPAYVRKVQAEHMDSNGWSDIGYSYCVCEHGVVFEGRGLTRRNSANGDVPLNEAHYAVCAFLGSSGSTEPTPEQLQGLRDAIEYCQRQGPAGAEVKGHKDGYSTDCPGTPLYSWVQAGAPRPNTPAQEDDMPLTDADADKVAHSVLYWLTAAYNGIQADPGDHPLASVIPALRARLAAAPGEVWNYKLPHLKDDWTADGTLEAYWYVAGKDISDRAVARAFADLQAKLAAQDAAITALAAQITAQHPGVDTAAVVTAVRQEIANATVRVQVDVAGTPANAAPKTVAS